jgi:hypothetical protein
MHLSAKVIKNQSAQLKLLLIVFVCYLLSGTVAAKTILWTKIQHFADNGFEPKIEGLRVDGGISKNDIIKRFGKPLKDSSIKTKGSDPDEILTWEYKGLTIILYRPMDSSEGTDYYWISKIMLTNPDYSLKYGLKIGEPRSAFLKQLGNPGQEIGRLLIYNTDNYSPISENVSFAGHIQVSIEFDKEDKAKKIIWGYSWD